MSDKGIKKYINKVKNYVDTLRSDKKKFKKIIMTLVIVLLVIIGIIYFLFIRVGKEDKNTAEYDEIVSMLKNEDTFLIYYYNSKSKNKNNKEIKAYLDELKINYFNYNDALVGRKEYDDFLKLFGIDKSVFGLPAIIYVRDGKMYSNVINIDRKEVVDNFVESYDLYTVK